MQWLYLLYCMDIYFCSQFIAVLGNSDFANDNFHIYNLNCTGAESSIFNCYHSLANSQDLCPSSNDAFIQCNGIIQIDTFFETF